MPKREMLWGGCASCLSDPPLNLLPFPVRTLTDTQELSRRRAFRSEAAAGLRCPAPSGSICTPDRLRARRAGPGWPQGVRQGHTLPPPPGTNVKGSHDDGIAGEFSGLPSFSKELWVASVNSRGSGQQGSPEHLSSLTQPLLSANCMLKALGSRHTVPPLLTEV